jgi:hypothetical protein
VELEFPGFKMSEKAPYEVPPARPFTEFLIKGIKEVEKLYGSVFTIRFIKYALRFLAQKVGEEPPKNIETLEQLAEYAISKSEVYPTPYAMVTYAQAKTENEFQGYSGAGTTMEMVALSKDAAEGSNIKDKNVDMDDIIMKLSQFLTAVKYSPKEWGYRINVDGSVDIVVPKCYLMDGCRMAYNENLLKRRDGKMRCGIIHFVCGYFKLATGYVWDYDFLEYRESHCILKCSIRYR